MTDASAIAGTHRQRGLAWVRQAGGVRPRRGRGLRGRYLSFGEREEIALGRAGVLVCGQVAITVGLTWAAIRVAISAVAPRLLPATAPANLRTE